MSRTVHGTVLGAIPYTALAALALSGCGSGACYAFEKTCTATCPDTRTVSYTVHYGCHHEHYTPPPLPPPGPPADMLWI